MKNLFTFLAMLIAMPVLAIDPITGPTTVCAGSTITLSDAAASGTWSSSNPTVAAVGASTGIVTGTLSASTPGTATISYTTSTETATMDITVDPTPVLTSTLTPPAICDSTLFTYLPVSSLAGTTFAWTRPYVPGIVSLAASGTGEITEYPDNSSIVPVAVKYIIHCQQAAAVTMTRLPLWCKPPHSFQRTKLTPLVPALLIVISRPVRRASPHSHGVGRL